MAHTSAIYFIVNGESFRDREQAPAIAAKRTKALDFIEERLQNPGFVKGYASGEVDALRDRIRQARAEYTKLSQ